jgi:hypothetical protein
MEIDHKLLVTTHLSTHSGAGLHTLIINFKNKQNADLACKILKETKTQFTRETIKLYE